MFWDTNNKKVPHKIEINKGDIKIWKKFWTWRNWCYSKSNGNSFWNGTARQRKAEATPRWQRSRISNIWTVPMQMETFSAIGIVSAFCFKLYSLNLWDQQPCWFQNTNNAPPALTKVWKCLDSLVHVVVNFLTFQFCSTFLKKRERFDANNFGSSWPPLWLW